MASSVSVSVHVRDATATGLRRVRNSINSLNRGIVMGLAGAMSDGIGQGLANGLRQAANNPYVASAILILVGALVTQIGTALAAALTLVFGGAFVTLAAISASKSKEVQRNWETAAKKLKADFKEIGEPLIPVIHRAIHVLEGMSTKFTPHFKKAMENAAPFLDRFVNKLSTGLEKGGKAGFHSMMRAFNELLDAIKWDKWLEDTGIAFGRLGDIVTKNTEDVAGVFDGVLSILPKVINLISMLAEAWSRIKPWFDLISGIVITALTPAFKILGTVLGMVFEMQQALMGPLGLLHRMMKAFYEEAMVPIGDFLAGTLGPLWDGLVEGFKRGWEILERDLVPILRELWNQLKETTRETLALVPGFEGLRDSSQSAGKVLKEWIIDKMTALGEWIREHREELLMVGGWIAKGIAGAIAAIAYLIILLPVLADWVNRAWNLFLMVTGIDSVIQLIGKLGELWGWVTRNWETILEVTGINFIIDAIGKLQELWGWVRRNWGINLLVLIPGVGGAIAAIQELWSWVNRNWSRNVNFNFSVSGAWDTIKGLVGRAHGGVVGQAATGGARSNMTLVGEQGPELVNLAPGSHVKSNPDTRRLMGRANGNAAPATTLIIKSNGSRSSDLILELLRDAIHDAGGDPVKVLGG